MSLESSYATALHPSDPIFKGSDDRDYCIKSHDHGVDHLTLDGSRTPASVRGDAVQEQRLIRAIRWQAKRTRQARAGVTLDQAYINLPLLKLATAP